MVLPHESFNSAPGVSSFVRDQKHAVDSVFNVFTTANLICNSRSGKKNKELSQFCRLLVKALSSR